MSDRSGVGAPMHDGADPDPADAGAEPGTSDGAASRPGARGDGSDARSVPRTRRSAESVPRSGVAGENVPRTRRPAEGVTRGDDAAEGGVPGDSAEAVAPAEGAPRTRRAASRLKERLSNSHLFAAALGAEPAVAPPGVPTDSSEARAASPATPPGSAPRRGAAHEGAEPHAESAGARSVGAASDRPVLERDPRRRFPVRQAEEPAPIDATAVAAATPAATRGSVPQRGPLRARQVHRVVRRVDPWSVLKLSLLFYFCVWLMFTIAGVLIWGVAVGSGTVESLESFIATLLAFEEFAFNADQIFRLFAMGGLIMVFLFTALSAILAVLFNLISDLIGGIRVTVIEEETTRRIVRRA